MTAFANACRGQDSFFIFDLRGRLTAEAPGNLVPPHILAQPQPQVAAPGALASFFVIAANTGDLTYQWRYNGADISGATNDALLLQNIDVTNEGQYSVVLVNSSGSVTSAPAALLLDGDRDGLPDSWELANFGNLNQSPTGDFDGDGVSNRDEFLDGTNPASSASARFRLTVLSKGGLVEVTPSSLSYTNGEVVTLTATAFSPNIFRRWTGDTNTTSNPLTLTMTTNITVFAHQGSENLIWNAGNGDWHVASNWEPNFVPTTNDNVFITSTTTVTVNSPAECGSLTFGGSGTPTLTGAGTLTVHHDSTWQSGHMSGTGRTIIPAGVTLNLAKPGTISLTTRTLENGGMVRWAGVGNIIMNGAVITNRAGALFETRGAGALSRNGDISRFDNAGTFRKAVNTGTTTVFGGVVFNNYGTVEIETGTLALSGGGANSGTIELSAGTTLNLGGAYSATGASSITGAGNLTMSGGATLAGLVNVTGVNLFRSGTVNVNGNYICTNILNIAGGTANFSGNGAVTPATLNLTAGTLGGNQTVTVLGGMSWTGGGMSGSGRTIIPPGVTLNLANPGTIGLTTRTLENGGTAIWTGGDIILAGAVITNRAGALFETRSAGGLEFNGGSSRFDNAGTFRKAVNTGTTTVFGGVVFNNYGMVEIETGTLALGGGGTHSGTFDISTGTTLNFTGGDHTASSGSSITGAGNFTVASGTATLAGLVNVSGTNTFSGTANLTGNYICTNNTLTISGGTANFSGTGAVTPATLNLNSGTLSGNQLVTVLGVMNWTGGTMSGSGRTIIPPGVTLNLANPGTIGLTTRTLDNGGTVRWTGVGNIIMNGAVITNRAGALFETRGAGGLSFNAGAPRFDNAGMFRKAVNTGTTTVFGGVVFNNYGTVEIETGTLALSGGGANSGTMMVPTGTTLNLGGVHTGTGGSSITGAGNFTVASGTATLAGLVNVSGTNTFSGTANLTGNYICTNNTLTISGGTANFSGTGAVTPATLNLNSGTLSGNQLVTVLGVMNWTGGTMSGSGRTIIPPGVTLNLANPGTIGLTTRTLDNGGTVRWAGVGNIIMNGAVITNRAGALFETRGAGGLSFNAGAPRFDNAGTFRKAVNTGTTTVFGGVVFNNYGTVEIETGTLALSGGYTSTTNSVLQCAIGGTTVGSGYGRLQVSGAVTLNGALRVALTNGFVPAVNDLFTVLTAGTRNGTFANFFYPSNEVSMQMSNTVNSVIVSVSEVLAVPQPVLLPPEISGPDILLSWTAVSNLTYRLEFNPDLNPANWTGLAGDILSLSNLASRLEALPSSNRFYRVRVVP